jgi:hypothetical protein
MNIKRGAAIGALVAGSAVAGGAVASQCITSPPASIPTDCSGDATAALNSEIAQLPAGTPSAPTILNLATNGCYLVSNSTSSLLTIDGKTNLTINGNGSSFVQATYNNGSCATDVKQPVLSLTANTGLQLNGLTIKGPNTCGGAGTEGGYGVLVGGSAVGNTNVTMSGVTIKYTAGDGLAVYPNLGQGNGVNTGVTFTGGTLSNIGYHGVTLEGVDGFTFSHNAVSAVSNFMDMEVDTDICETQSCLGPSGNPISLAQYNVTVNANNFTSASAHALWIESEQGRCIPQKNLVITNNTLDSTVNAGMVLRGSFSTACPLVDGLTITNNKATYPSGSTCGGSPATPPAGCAIWQATDYQNVTITGNTVTATDGSPALPGTPYVICTALGGVTTATLQHNSCPNAWSYQPTGQYTDGLQFSPPNPGNTGVTACGNTYWLPSAPKTDASC